MLLKIREKAQGVFAWIILLLICIPFALWGIQNYLDVGKETPVVTVGDKDFFQRDVNRAYAEYSQKLAGMGVDEQTLKQQALNKLIRDEVLLQYVQDQGLVVTDDAVRSFISSLQYFQVEGRFDKKQYRALLAAQNMSSAEFEHRIRNALIMEQFQHSILDSSFATAYDVDRFLKIQNQQRDFEYVTIPLPKVTETPSDEEVQAYYQQHQKDYQTPEMVAIEYIELSLPELAAKVQATDQELQAFYEEHQDLYRTEERRKISHILFAAGKEGDEAALARAQKARERAETEDFTALAKELSDDKFSAKQGGDLGLFSVGTMEPAFEEAASKLKEGEISEPVKSAYGYHLIKVTELVPATTKPLSEVREEVKKAFQKSSAENTFYELSEILTEVSFEQPDNLLAASDATGIPVKKNELFARDSKQGIAAEDAIREAAFSEEVLQGNDSEPIELGTDRLVVLRVVEHQPAATRPLQEVRASVIAALQRSKARQQAEELAERIKRQLLAGESLQKLADAQGLELQKRTAVTRDKGDLPWQLRQAVFKAAKPVAGKPTVFIVDYSDGQKAVVSLLKVTAGSVDLQDAKQRQNIEANIAKVQGQAVFNAVIKDLQAKADVTINMEK